MQQPDQRRPHYDAIPLPTPNPNLNLGLATTLYFASTASQSVTIHYADLLDLYVFAATATACYDVFAEVKVKRVQVWSSIGTPTTNTASQLVFNGLVAPGDLKRHTAIAVGNRPGYIDAKPEKRTLAAQYQPTGNNTAFNLVLNQGDCVAVHLVFRGQLGGYEQAAQNASVGATVGATYVRGLDAKAIASTTLPPLPQNGVAI